MRISDWSQTCARPIWSTVSKRFWWRWSWCCRPVRGKCIRHGQSTALLHDTPEIIAPRNAKLNELSDNTVDTIAHRMGVRERSEERRVGKEGGSTCRSRGSPENYEKKETRR